MLLFYLKSSTLIAIDGSRFFDDSRFTRFFLCFFNSTFLLLFMIIGECVTNAMVMTMTLQDMGPARVFEGRPYTEGREATAESGRESGGSEQRHGRVGGD